MATIPSTEARVFQHFDDESDRFLPEGPRPIVLDDRDAVIWVNIQTAADARSGELHLRFWDNGELETWGLAGRPGFVLPTDEEGIVLVGMDKEIGTFDMNDWDWQPLAKIPDDSPRTIINDAEIVPGGRAVVFGTKDVKFADPIAGLYLFTLDDNRVSLLADRQVCSNGKVFAADDRGLILYDIDTPTKKVVRYRLDVSARTAAPDGVAIDTAAIAGFPDGMRGCGDGTAVIAFYNPDPIAAGRAVRFDLATGKPIEEWTTPGSPRVTCPLLVKRPEGVKLILTTATEGMPADQRQRCPKAGNLFIADTGLASCPEGEPIRLSV
jgi:sugar lactone lactonase YvrE